ncbi:serine hydrolase domain-containing protein [Mucilaginibacter ginsenosidivorans]|uniref:Beta-lactamase family protein n=1 Tax=Mucilaginibacter ginsenosidivorans TaxID=398053 RepID=A0A5B8V1Q9_9SPHI|nr:serine hydrolase domain-containing protein [Mucilaginibacter ginsenosidivorans]QEC65314.1 beta-lactamase family protein [Mucilaginibacter ginsenosidivorans]
MRTFLKHIFALLFAFIATSAAFSQAIPNATAKKIDSLFKYWDNNKSAGFTIGIVRNDSLIYAKGYGMANLEYNIPNTPETIFHMASVSKQFTAYAIVLLARQGKLNMDDDIRKYLTWFPDLKQKITIRNLLNHTSGIRDQWQLLAIAGTRLDDVITEDQIIKILSKQQALNFKPGDEWSYSNSGFTMLGEIVRSVTGKTLRQFTDSAIFKPLGMNHTHFHDDYTEIEPNRAYSYDKEKGHFINDVLSYSNAGATSLFTNIPDMSRWIMNFYDHKVGDQQDIETLTTKAVLNSGKVQDYAMGIGVDTYRGQKRYSHNGADAGFRTSVSVFPDLKMGFIVFSNVGDADPSGKSNQLANLFIADPSPKKKEVPKKYTDFNQAVLTDTVGIKKFTGDYLSADGAHFAYRLSHGKLYWITPYGASNLLIKAAKDTFEMFTRPEVKFLFGMDDKKIKVDQYWPDNHRLLVKYDTTSKSDKILQTYTGTYYSPELDCNYRIVLKYHKLVLTNAKYNDSPLKLYGDIHLTSNFWWMDNLDILRDGKNKITGFEVNSGRVQHVLFKKVE